MKNVYPDYRKQKISSESLYRNLPSLERKIVDDYLKYCSISVSAEAKLRDIKMHLVQFRDIIEKPLDNIDLEDIRDFLAVLNKSEREQYTKNTQKAYVKKFLRWRYKDWSLRFDDLKDIKLHKAFNEKRVNASTLITEEEFKQLLEASQNPKDRAMLVLLSETGARPQELRTITWKDIKFKETGLSEVTLFSGKTKRSRTAYIKESVKHLKIWKAAYPYHDRKNSDYVFPSPRNRSDPFPKATFWYWFKTLAKKARINRDIFPYLARHTLATKLYKKIPSPIAQRAMGHGADMSKVYTHLEDNDVRDALLESIYKDIEDITEEKQSYLEEKLDIVIKFIMSQADYPKEDLKKLARDLAMASVLTIDNKKE